MSTREEYVAGLRAVADWLEQNPGAPVPQYEERLLIPLVTNNAVAEVASMLGLQSELDDNGNAFIQVQFGPITYYAYGYVDFGQHRKEHDERQARRWADKNDMQIVPAVEDGAR